MDESLPSGATPLDPDESEGLIPSHVSTRGELDELEEANIQEGLRWAHGKALRRGQRTDVLTEDFLYELHQQMFGAVWEWAGQVRKTDKNIGIDKFQVRPEVRKLVEDTQYWRENEVYAPDEMAVRFHHRLVSIHPFPNGNGRHARMAADLLVQQAGCQDSGRRTCPRGCHVPGFHPTLPRGGRQKRRRSDKNGTVPARRRPRS